MAKNTSGGRLSDKAYKSMSDKLLPSLDEHFYSPNKEERPNIEPLINLIHYGSKLQTAKSPKELQSTSEKEGKAAEEGYGKQKTTAGRDLAAVAGWGRKNAGRVKKMGDDYHRIVKDHDGPLAEHLGRAHLLALHAHHLIEQANEAKDHEDASDEDSDEDKNSTRLTEQAIAAKRLLGHHVAVARQVHENSFLHPDNNSHLEGKAKEAWESAWNATGGPEKSRAVSDMAHIHSKLHTALFPHTSSEGTPRMDLGESKSPASKSAQQTIIPHSDNYGNRGLRSETTPDKAVDKTRTMDERSKEDRILTEKYEAERKARKLAANEPAKKEESNVLVRALARLLRKA